LSDITGPTCVLHSVNQGQSIWVCWKPDGEQQNYCLQRRGHDNDGDVVWKLNQTVWNTVVFLVWKYIKIILFLFFKFFFWY